MPDPSLNIVKPQVLETPYKEWSAENGYPQKTVESITRYGDHLRTQWQEADRYSIRVERDITQAQANALSKFGFLTPDNQSDVQKQIEDLYAPSPLVDAKQILRYLPYTGEEDREDSRTFDDSVISFEDHENVHKFVALTEEGLLEESYSNYGELLESIRVAKEESYKDLYRRGEIGAAVYQDAEGKDTFLGGEIPKGRTKADVLKSAVNFGVTPRHFFTLEYFGEAVAEAHGLPRFEVKKRYEAYADLSVFLDEKKSFEDYDEKIDGLSEAYARRTTYSGGDKNWAGVSDLIQEWVSRPLTHLFGDDDRKHAVVAASLYEDAQEHYAEHHVRIREELILELHKETGNSLEVVADSIDQMILNNAGGKNMLLFHGDDEDLHLNVHKGVFQLPVVHSSLMALPDKFNKALDQAGVTGAAKTGAQAQRVLNLTKTYELKSEVLAEEYGDEWHEAVLSGRQKGLANHKILEGFAGDTDNFSRTWATVEGLGYSVWAEGVGSLFYGAGAMFGSDWAREGLLDIAEGRAHRTELAGIFGMERSFLHEAGEAIAPMIVDIAFTAALSAATVPTGGASLAAAAGYVGAKTSTRVAMRTIFAQTLKGTLRVGAGESMEAAAKRVFGKQLLGDVTEQRVLSVIKAYNGELASKMGIATATFIPAATRSSVNTYGVVFKNVSDDLTAQHSDADGNWVTGWSAGRVKEEAHDYALGGGLAAGMITGLITSAMGLIGRGGMEDALLKGVTYKQMKQIGDRVLGRNMGDMSFQKLIKGSIQTVLKKQRFEGLKHGVLRNAFDEGIEEAFDEFLNGFVQDIASNQDTSILDRFSQAGHAALLGATLGAGSTAIGKVARKVRPEKFTDRSAMARYEQSLFKQYEEDVITQELTEDLKASGAPTTAAEVERLVHQYKRAESTGGDSGSGSGDAEGDVEGEALDILEEHSAETIEADADRIERDLNEASEGVISDITNKVLTNATQTPAPDPSMRGSEAAETILQSSEGDSKAGLNQATSQHSPKQLEHDPELNHKNELADINKKANRYKKLAAELNKETDKAEIKRLEDNLEALLDSGAVLDPTSAKALRKQSKARTQLALKNLKEAETRGFTPSEEKAIEAIVETGYPHTLSVNQLDKLGLSLENADSATLEALSREAQKRTNKKFPPLPTAMPEGGASIPRAFGKSGKVYLDSKGRGVFNNDPVGMLTLVESNIPVLVPKDKVAQLEADGKLNPSFRFREQGDQMVLEDIMVRESGGVVSAKTAFNRVGVLEEDYYAISYLAAETSRLREEVEIDESLKVVSPLSGRMIKVSTLLKQLRDIPTLKQLIASDSSLNLNKNFVEAAAIATSLELQASVYEYVNNLNNNVEVGPTVANLDAIKDKQGEYFSSQQRERAKRAKRSLVSILEPDTNIHKTELFNVEENGADSNFVPPRTNPQEPLSPRKVNEFISDIHGNASLALGADPALLNRVKEMLSTEYYGGKSTEKFTPEQTFDALVHFMAKGNALTNRKAVDLQVALRAGEHGASGKTLRNSFRLLALSTPSVELDPSKDADYLALVTQELQTLSGADADITATHAIDFFKDIKKGVETYHARALIDGRSRAQNEKFNAEEVAKLGLVSGDPESVIAALEVIAAGKNKTQAVVAKLLLQNKKFIRSVEFSLVSNASENAGVFTYDANGTSLVDINIGRRSARGVADTLLHEYIHAFSFRVIKKPPEARTDAENKSIRSLEALLKVVRKKATEQNASETILYGTQNLDEFIAVFLTSPKFQDYVKGLTADEGGRSLFERIMDKIGLLLNKGKLSKEFNQALQNALDLTQSGGITTEPETEAGFRNQVASAIRGSQTRRSKLASSIGLGEDTSVNEQLDAQAEEHFKWASEFVPSGLNIVMDNTTDVIAEWDVETQSLLLNGRKAAAYLNHVAATSGGKPVNNQHALATILNEAMAPTIAFEVLPQTEVESVMDSLSDTDGEWAINQVYLADERADARERLNSSDPDTVKQEKLYLAEKSLTIHAQKVLNGSETTPQAAFLLRNPNLVGTWVTYFKRFVEKISYHKTLAQVSPEMRIAVNRMVNEMRSMKAGYRVTPNGLHFDADNPQEVLEKFARQLHAQETIRTKEAVDYRGAHEAPDEGATMSSMDDGTYPSDIYSEDGARLYGHGGSEDVRDKKIHSLLLSVRGNPDATVTVYRSVPSDAEGDINEGDWVSPELQYAEDHGARTLGDEGYKILTKEVKAGELVTEGNSLYEFGYSPREAPSVGHASPAISQPEYGDAAHIPTELDAESLDLSPFVEMLDVPLYKIGEWKEKDGFINRVWQLLVGHGHKDVRDAKTDRDGFVRETKHMAEKYKADHDKIIEESETEIPARLISQASGSNRGSQLTTEQTEAVETAYRKELAEAKKDPELEELARINRADNVNKVRASNHKVMLTERNNALAELLKVSPKMHALVLSARKLVDEMSLKGNKIFGDIFSKNQEFALTFDNNRGIYMVRRYRMFADADFAKRVLSDPAYATARAAAVSYFADQHLKYTAKQIKLSSDAPITMAEALAIAKEEAFKETEGDAELMGQKMMEEFINSYKTKEFKGELAAYEGADRESELIFTSKPQHSKSLKSLLDTFSKEKTNIPSPLRKILGEFDEDSGIDNILETIIHTGSTMARQQMSNDLVTQGMQGKSPWIITKKDYLLEQKKAKADPEYKNPYADWIPMQEKEGGAMDWSPFKGKYIRPDSHNSLKNLFHKEVKDVDTTGKQVYQIIFRALQKLTGTAMAMKTLGSTTFYERNMFGNATFFGPAQGYFGGIPLLFKEVAGTLGIGKKSWREESMVVRLAIGTRAEVDAELSALRSMNVWGDEINAEVLNDLLMGTQTIDSVEGAVTELGEKISNLKGVKGSKALAKRLSRKATALASAMDAYYKVGYYKFELDTLIEAAKADPTGLGTLLNEDGTPTPALKKEAAKIVKMTSQSYSQALPFIKLITRTEVGVLLAPYLRFAAEIPRITVNTQKQYWRELKSGNPVLQRRGARRFAGWMGTVPLFSVVVPNILLDMAGIDDDEEEGLRLSLQWYAKRNTLYYTGKGKTLREWNLTYFNPFAVVADPFGRGFDDLMRGEGIASASWKVISGLMLPYVGEQILMGAMTDVIQNKDTFGNKITLGRDSWTPENIGKNMLYILEKAYGPRTPMKIVQAIKASQDDTVKAPFGPWDIIAGEFKPVRGKPVEIDSRFRNFLWDHSQRYNRLSFHTLKSRGAMNRSDVEDLYDEVYVGRKELNEELMRVMRGYESLGLPARALKNELRSKRVSGDREQLARNKLMYRPLIPSDILKHLRDNGQEQRIEWLQDYRASKGHNTRHLPLDDD